jgi:hypothetical protein
MKTPPSLRCLLLTAVLFAAGTARAWDAEGHRIVARLGLAALPVDYPAFARDAAAASRIDFLTNVPDRWRNVDPWLKQSGASWTDHFFDVEQVPDAGLDLQTLSSFRLDFAVAFAAGRAAHPEKFKPIDPARNLDHTREWPGSAPWAIADWFNKLRSAFGYLKAYEELGGTPEEIANAREDVIYAMGVLAHYVGDCAQPLHTTVHHNGWDGPNPNGYTTWGGFHSWIDGSVVARSGITADSLLQRVKPGQALALNARNDGRDPFFVVALDYIIEQHKLVEPLYQLEKAGKLGNEKPGPDGKPPFPPKAVAPEGRAFVEERLLTGGNMLATFWASAWKSAPVDTYLRAQLAKRTVVAVPVKTTP